MLTGGGGADVFQFSTNDSTLAVSGRDTILDFSRADGDKINLVAIDANAGAAGDQAFSFVGAAAFSGAAGQLRVERSGADFYAFGDVNGDAVADFNLLLRNLATLGAVDFIL